MQALHFAWQDRWLPLTVSIGVVALAGQSVNDAFAQGDAACRTAKNRGRNRIHVYHAGDREIALRTLLESPSLREVLTSWAHLATHTCRWQRHRPLREIQDL